MRKKNMAGFTIIEMLVTVGVLALLSGILIVYSKSGENASALLRQAAKMVADVNRAKNLAMTTALYTTQEGDQVHPCGYGVYFDDESTPNRYIIFADVANNCKNSDHSRPDDGITDVEVIELTTSISIDKKNIDSVFFLPPDPIIYFDPEEETEGLITIKTSVGSQLEIKISGAGQVSTF